MSTSNGQVALIAQCSAYLQVVLLHDTQRSSEGEEREGEDLENERFVSHRGAQQTTGKDRLQATDQSQIDRLANLHEGIYCHKSECKNLKQQGKRRICFIAWQVFARH